MTTEAFRLKRIAVRALADLGLNIDPARINFALAESAVRALLIVATQEDCLRKVPATWWDHLKDATYTKLQRSRMASIQGLGLWLRTICPVRWAEIMAIHKYPELGVPETLGQEFVHLEIRRLDEEKP